MAEMTLRLAGERRRHRRGQQNRDEDDGNPSDHRSLYETARRGFWVAGDGGVSLVGASGLEPLTPTV